MVEGKCSRTCEIAMLVSQNHWKGKGFNIESLLKKAFVGANAPELVIRIAMLVSQNHRKGKGFNIKSLLNKACLKANAPEPVKYSAWISKTVEKVQILSRKFY